jgi:tight adherence protein B
MSLLVFLFFCILAVVLIASAIAFIILDKRRKQQVTGVLRTVADAPAAPERPVILIERPNEGDFFKTLLARLDLARKIQSHIAQAGLEWNIAQFAAVSAILGILGILLGLKFNVLIYRWLSSPALGALLCFAPYLYVRSKRKARLAVFEEQFPEALDFLSRSMRAGHAFSVSLEMLGAESPDPLGREFRTLFNEQNLGANIDVALAGLVRRVPILDVRFFVSAVMLQRQTGGNLSEILTRLGYVIRERFQLRGQVKAASAHGRITAGILTVMPVLMVVALSFLAPSYLQILVSDPDGKYLILGAVLAQLLGYLTIRRIVNIKV